MADALARDVDDAAGVDYAVKRGGVAAMRKILE